MWRHTAATPSARPTRSEHVTFACSGIRSRAIRNACRGVSLGADRPAAASNLLMKHLWIREETRCTASVPEDDRFTASDGAIPDQGQKA